ncbi:MAG: hypothetical protein HOH14_05265 [Gammaproteobacteria bacterium]|nr:hypothetical protein [Gammaproteobacteria bacterium]MBT6042885.1 hypothetical protein [Gammaproteobacteria bacterium]
MLTKTLKCSATLTGIFSILALSWGTLAQAQPSPENTEVFEPAPRNAAGRVILSGANSTEKGVWTPRFSIFDPIAPVEVVPFKPWAKALYDERQLHELEPHARCKASGLSRQFLTPYGVEFVELPELNRILIFDIGGPHTYRVVYMDGRSHPSDLEVSNYGHSVGWWEGDTLVIDSVGFNEDFWFGRRGLPHTEQLHTIERFTRYNANRIDYKITVDDPGAYTASYTGGFNLGWSEGTELFEYVCQQANYAHELMVGQESDAVDRSSPIVP